MSLEIYLYTKNATKEKLIKELKLQGFKSSESKPTQTEKYYFWFESNNFESFSGVQATVMKVSIEDQKKYNCSEWILHTRTKSWGGYLDKQKQNDVIRHLRSIFGGSFSNDWYGTNKYTNIDDYPKYSAPERGLILMRDNINNKISGLEYTLSQLPESILGLNFEDSETEFIKSMKAIDPSLTIYNAMLPFVVSIIEYMFKETFLILIRFDSKAQEEVKNANLKVPLEKVIKIKTGEILIEDLIADSFTFQNMNKVNLAYEKYLNIDINSVLSVKKKVNNRIFRILRKVEETIELRHSIVHHFGYSTDLDKSLFLEYLTTAEVAMDLLLKHIEQKYSWKIEKI